MMKTRVMIVDDHPVMRMGLTELIEHEPDLEVCGTAAEVTEAMQMIDAVHPDVAVVDISLRGGNGIELIEQAKARHSEIKMLVASMYDEVLFAERALRAGAMGFINKQEPPEEILSAPAPGDRRPGLPEFPDGQSAAATAWSGGAPPARSRSRASRTASWRSSSSSARE